MTEGQACRPPPLSRGSGFVSNVVIYADCHSSNKGLFAGLIVLAGSFLSIILFFVAMADRLAKYLNESVTIAKLFNTFSVDFKLVSL